MLGALGSSARTLHYVLTSPQLGGTFLGSHWKYQAQVGTGTFRCCPLIPRSESWSDSETRCIDTGSQGCSVLHPSGLPLVCLQMLVPRVWRNGPSAEDCSHFCLCPCLLASLSLNRIHDMWSNQSSPLLERDGDSSERRSRGGSQSVIFGNVATEPIPVCQ